MENRVALPFKVDRSELKWFQALDCRNDLAQSKVGDCNKRNMKKLIQSSGIRTEEKLPELSEKCLTHCLIASGQGLRLGC